MFINCVAADELLCTHSEAQCSLFSFSSFKAKFVTLKRAAFSLVPSAHSSIFPGGSLHCKQAVLQLLG